MYHPAQYAKNDPAYLFEFIQQHPFATMVLQGQQLLATHIPVFTKGGANSFNLFSHITNSDPQYKLVKDGVEALFIFLGPNAYVSPSKYNYDDICAWNYSAVHVRATLYLQTTVQLETSLYELVYRCEKDQAKPCLYQDIPKAKRYDYLSNITGFTAVPTQIKGIAKLHQGVDKKNMKHFRREQSRTYNQAARKAALQINKENA